MFGQTGEIQGLKVRGELSVSFGFTPTDAEQNQTKGSIFVLLNIKGADEEKNLAWARSIFATFKNKFYTVAGSNLKVLEDSLDFVKDDLRVKGVEADILVANLWGSVLYVGKMGKGGFLLVRGGKPKKIDVAKVASGVLSNSDNVLLVDGHFLGNIDMEAIGNIVSGEDFKDTIKKLNEVAMAKEGSAFCLRLSVQKPVETVQPILMADLDKKEENSGKEKPPTWSIDEDKRDFNFRLPASLSPKFLTKHWPQAKIYLKKIGRVVRELLRRASFIILAPWLPKTVGSLEEPTQRKRKQIFQIVVLLVGVLVISIVVGVFNHSRRTSSEKFEKSISLIESKLSDAKNLENINAAQAATLLQEATAALEDLDANDPKIAKLQEEIEALAAKINKIYTVKLEEVADLTILKGGISTTDLKFTSGALFVLDTGTGSVYKVGLSDKKPTILVSETKNLQNIGVSGDFLYVQSKTGIKKVDTETGTSSDVASASTDWQTLIAASTYRENLYLLDSKAKQIWKHVPVGGVLSNPQSYLEKEFKDTPVSFAVDGAVWVATKNKIYKFFGGKEDKFSLKGAPIGFSSIVDIYTEEGVANLYVLDKSEGGVFVIEKSSGKYLGFYKPSNIASAKALSVDEPNKTVYVLIKNEVRSFKLK